ncbi:hypothetical protein DDB_G0271350 [Dictyostelium discoideum AX4]|uniref:Probable dual specificity protein phosphatase DDB_G0271350 n=1 Tax=Dictyostelium discoideum TaxID=44689 RepID=DUSP3_DICDI|nr:hypothetical protein DDB_G0271350 [Dictyostelium discoideum AX4]Q55BI8.1 RecName: Full=Probable dual specificity protein phosphatase DDB_G0271350 [Dictyostelium discoideum]EAL71805.1 hypothetical protein DDB_G0271350 [Dictyostelium discoideum AX4]|eukprot:XP_645624.1 hypothetical protein DDB_G0271350 [Dictyostelium discoideum AX4]
MGISMILDNFLYLGAAKDTKDEKEMEKLKITHIFSCAGTVHSPEKYIIANEKFEDDETVDISEQIEKAYWFIERVRMKKGARVFIHCMAGKSRSASIVLSYLLKRDIHSLSDCLFYLHSKRLEIRPNDGFMNQLCDLELKLTNKQTLSKEIKEWRSLQSKALKTKIDVQTCHFIQPSLDSTKKANEQYLLHIQSISFTFFEIHLNQDKIIQLYQQQCQLLHSNNIDIKYFTSILQEELSNSTKKAFDFLLIHYYLDWQDIINNLLNYTNLKLNLN